MNCNEIDPRVSNQKPNISAGGTAFSTLTVLSKSRERERDNKTEEQDDEDEGNTANFIPN